MADGAGGAPAGVEEQAAELRREASRIRKAAKDPALNEAIPPELDKAGLRTRAKLMPVYMAKDANGQLESLILPIYGQGLWSTMYGFISLSPDGNTVKGIIQRLNEEADTARRYLDICELEVLEPRYTDDFVLKLLYELINKGTSLRVKLPEGVFDMTTEVHGVYGE